MIVTLGDVVEVLKDHYVMSETPTLNIISLFSGELLLIISTEISYQAKAIRLTDMSTVYASFLVLPFDAPFYGKLT